MLSYILFFVFSSAILQQAYTPCNTTEYGGKPSATPYIPLPQTSHPNTYFRLIHLPCGKRLHDYVLYSIGSHGFPL